MPSRFFTITLPDSNSMIFDLYKVSKKSRVLSAMVDKSSASDENLGIDVEDKTPTWDMSCPGSMYGLKIVHLWIENNYDAPAKFINPITHTCEISEGDSCLTKLTRNEILEVNVVATYLNIEEMENTLAQLLCNKMLALPEQSTNAYRTFLNLPNDLTWKDKQKLRAKYVWA